jgi:GGDEF domain-containing protein
MVISYIVMLQLSNKATIFLNDECVTISRGQGEEKLLLNIKCPNEGTASEIFNRLKNTADPFIAFQESLWETYPGLTAHIITKFGKVKLSFDEPGFRLPTSPNHIPQPSKLRDQGTGLKLRAGLIRDELEGEVISVGQLDIANLGATNLVCGENFANSLFSKLGAIAKRHGVNLYRYGGDEFAFTVSGETEEANLVRIKNFINDVHEERNKILGTLDPDTLEKLEYACEQSRIKKNRPFRAEALDLYVGVASIKNTSVEDQGLLIQQLVCKAEKQVYRLKQTDERFSCIFLTDIPPPRSSDVRFVENVRKLDRAALKIKELLARPDLPIPDRYHLFQELIVVCSEDVALGNGVVRAERLEPFLIYLTQGMEQPSYVVLDIPAGVLNDTIGPERTDELFSELLGSLFIDGSVLTIRTSGGGFKFVFTSDKFSDSQLKDLREEVHRRYEARLSAIEWNLNLPRGEILNGATVNRAA